MLGMGAREPRVCGGVMGSTLRPKAASPPMSPLPCAAPRVQHTVCSDPRPLPGGRPTPCSFPGCASS